MSRESDYAPRNALNADDLKAGIARRSGARGDADEVRDWLLNHFLRHLVANFEPAKPIRSLEEAREALAPAPPPAWVGTRFSASGTRREGRDAPLVWVDPDAPSLLALEARLVEFLKARQGTSLEGKLSRVNCPQALALWEKEHADMAVKIAQGWRRSNPAALEARLSTANGRFVEFRREARELRGEMAFESYAMRHCLGQFADRERLRGGYGESYAEAIETGRMRLFSFRDAGGQPHITVSLLVRADGKLRVEQVKGKQNRPPVERYVDDLIACLNAIETDDEIPEDCVRIGVVRTEAGWQRLAGVSEAGTQLSLVNRHPVLYLHLAQPTPAVEWLVAGREPALFATRAPVSATLSRMRSPEGGSDDWPDHQASRPAPRHFEPFGFLWLSVSFFLMSALARMGVPSLLLLAGLGFWAARRYFKSRRLRYFTGQRGFALALALPMATQFPGFFETDTETVTEETKQYFRGAFLHYMECRADASDEEARAHLARTLASSWPRADLHMLEAAGSPRAALAFAICRLAFFLRNAAWMGWLDEKAAWRAQCLNACRAREIFTGWEDFGRAYLAGRRQWIAAYRADPLGRFDEATLRSLLADRKNPWGKRTPWPKEG